MAVCTPRLHRQSGVGGFGYIQGKSDPHQHVEATKSYCERQQSLDMLRISHLPRCGWWELPTVPAAAFVHICSNPFVKGSSKAFHLSAVTTWDISPELPTSFGLVLYNSCCSFIRAENPAVDSDYATTAARHFLLWTLLTVHGPHSPAPGKRAQLRPGKRKRPQRWCASPIAKSSLLGCFTWIGV